MGGGHAHLIEAVVRVGQASALWLRFVAVSWVFTQNGRTNGQKKKNGRNGKFLFMKIKQVNFDRRLPRGWP